MSRCRGGDEDSFADVVEVEYIVVGVANPVTNETTMPPGDVEWRPTACTLHLSGT